jgi:hypothetical protein
LNQLAGVPESRRKTSLNPLVSLATRLVARLENAVKRPSALFHGSWLVLLPSMPLESTLSRIVSPVVRSLRKTSPNPFVSPATRLVASL